MTEYQEQFTQEDDLAGRYLTFCIDDVAYGIELLHVLEIISMQSITRIPQVPDYIQGIINLRGKIVPVADVRRKLGKPEITYDERTCIIVVAMSEVSVGLIVDRVSEVVTIASESLITPPELSLSGSGQYLSSISNTDGGVILNIDLARFFLEEIGEQTT